MLELRKEIKLTYEGEQYSAVMTFDNIRKVYNQVDLAVMYSKALKGKLNLLDSAEIISAFLNVCGCETDAESVYIDVFKDGGLSVADVNRYSLEIMQSTFPSEPVDAKKKPVAKAKTTAKK